jgi:hypothetical protein
MILRFFSQSDSLHGQIFRKAGLKKAEPNRPVDTPLTPLSLSPVEEREHSAEWSNGWIDAMPCHGAVPVHRKTYSFQCNGTFLVGLLGWVIGSFFGIAAWHWSDSLAPNILLYSYLQTRVSRDLRVERLTSRSTGTGRPDPRRDCLYVLLRP